MSIALDMMMMDKAQSDSGRCVVAGPTQVVVAVVVVCGRRARKFLQVSSKSEVM